MGNEELYDEFDFSSTPESDSDSDFSDDETRTKSFIVIYYNFLASRKKSIDQPIPIKSQIASNSIQPPGLKPPSMPLSVSKPVSLPALNVIQSSSKESIEPVVKVLSPPPVPQTPPVNKISGPSFASALAAATATGVSQSLATSGNNTLSIPVKSSNKQFGSGAFEELESFFTKKFPSKIHEENVSKFLAASYQNLPDNYELERNRQYSPKQPYAMPSYYQSEPPQILNNPSIFERFDLDTLFFIFYYQQKTYPQYLIILQHMYLFYFLDI